MTLKLNLADNESILVGKARVKNSTGSRVTLAIYGSDRVLRESLIMQEYEATTLAKRYYFMVMSLYISDDRESLYSSYHDVARELVQTHPNLALPVTEISQLILNNDLYEALNCAHLIVDIEEKHLHQIPEEDS